MFTHLYDDIVCCAGFRRSLNILGETCEPDLAIEGRFPELTEERESVNVRKLSIVGDVPFDNALHSSHFAFERRVLPRLLTTIRPIRRGMRCSRARLALHPRLFLLEHGRIMSEHRMLEDLEAKWFEESLYIHPLQACLEGLSQALSKQQTRTPGNQEVSHGTKDSNEEGRGSES